MSIALGMGGYQPRAPEDVLSTGFGDCKDKATLFVAALNRMGVTAFPVILNSSGGVKRDLPSINQFDHAIAAYRRKGASSYEYADLTAELTPLGELPFSEQGAFGLVVHPDGATEEIALPKVAITQNRRETHIAGALGTDGVFNGTYDERATGALQGELREAFSNPVDSTTRAKAATEIAGRWFQAAEGDSLVGFAGKDLGVTPTLHIRIRHGKAATISGNTVILKNPFGSMANMAVGAKQLEAEPTRRFPIDPSKIFGSSEALVELRVTLPERWRAQLPPNVVATGPFGTYRAEYAQTGRELVLSRRVSGGGGIQPPSARPALTAWMQEIAKDDANFIVIQKMPP